MSQQFLLVNTQKELEDAIDLQVGPTRVTLIKEFKDLATAIQQYSDDEKLTGLFQVTTETIDLTKSILIVRQEGNYFSFYWEPDFYEEAPAKGFKL